MSCTKCNYYSTTEFLLGTAGEEEIRRDTDDQHGRDEDLGQVAKCDQFLSFMKDPIGRGGGESNAHAEGERQLPSQCGFDKSQASEVIGMSGDETKVQARRRVQNRAHRRCRQTQRLSVESR